MTDTLDPVAQALAQAQQAAAATPAQTPSQNVPATQAAGSTAVGMPSMAGAPLTMETIGSGGMSVDAWLKVKETGLYIGDDKTAFETLKVILDMTTNQGFMPKLSAKAGNPAIYYSTFDGALTTSGKPWNEALTELKRINPKTEPYRAVDLPFVMNQKVESTKAKGTVLIEEGQRLGYSTSTTNWANWENFYRQVVAKGFLNQKVEVELGYQARTNKAGNEWGVVTFKLIGPADEAAD